jgi:hypothetical protein
MVREGPGITHILSGGFANASVRPATSLPYRLQNAFAGVGVKEEALLHLEYPLVHEGINANGDEFIASEMTMAYKTLIGSPLDKDHDSNIDAIVGQHFDARLETDASGLVIWCEAFIWADLYPDVARKLECGVVDGVSMECKFAWAEKMLNRRVLHDCTFIGAGLVRLPADHKARVIVKKKPVAYSMEQRAAASMMAMAMYKGGN